VSVIIEKEFSVRIAEALELFSKPDTPYELVQNPDVVTTAVLEAWLEALDHVSRTRQGWIALAVVQRSYDQRSTHRHRPRLP
jgi:hypothetical protein